MARGPLPNPPGEASQRSDRPEPASFRPRGPRGSHPEVPSSGWPGPATGGGRWAWKLRQAMAWDAGSSRASIRTWPYRRRAPDLVEPLAEEALDGLVGRGGECRVVPRVSAEGRLNR
jgi:hypothetical protein